MFRRSSKQRAGAFAAAAGMLAAAAAFPAEEELMRRSIAAVTATLAAAAATAIGFNAVAHAAAPQLIATFQQNPPWSNGYGGGYLVRNTGDAASTAWTLEF